MTTDDELRDFFAAFALVGLITRQREGENSVTAAYQIADSMLEERKPKQQGIAAIKTRRKKDDSAN
jgi:hypothetical protein